MDLKTELILNKKKLVFNLPLSNASGVHCINKDDLNELSSCRYNGTYISKSCTLELLK